MAVKTTKTKHNHGCHWRVQHAIKWFICLDYYASPRSEVNSSTGHSLSQWVTDSTSGAFNNTFAAASQSRIGNEAATSSETLVPYLTRTTTAKHLNTHAQYKQRERRFWSRGDLSRCYRYLAVLPPICYSIFAYYSYWEFIKGLQKYPVLSTLK